MYLILKVKQKHHKFLRTLITVRSGTPLLILTIVILTRIKKVINGLESFQVPTIKKFRDKNKCNNKIKLLKRIYWV
jgi:hypothetical protein